MDNKISMENLVNAIKVVRTNQKAQHVKIGELDKKFDLVKNIHDRLRKLEAALEKEKVETDNRFDKAIDRFDNINGVIDDHIEGISDLEEKYSLVSKKLEDIDCAISKFEREIKILEENSARNDVQEKEVKICKFNNFGFCNADSDCKFYHSEEKCEIYFNVGVCYRMFCKKRHPRVCKF